ncbi:GNAT family N-acetyltransferase [Bacillus subtilis]|uniref:GNAT family N-acetyltransferase n=1 Tax=Bacillus subtilis TaxID=1423 RepID=UPI0011908855|nr:GNAT family N-acetyltransferase [Bacillus subtilis]NMP48073.1 GNAT family N-acetyltransferase [Bacillus subtilis]TVX87719.1 GNAT family N-acetyltransferase [Bacillus subtilis]
MDDRNEFMKERIIKWGLPEALIRKKDVVYFKFNDDEIFNTKERGYHCKDGDVKFCLYDNELKRVLFSMEFFKRGSKLSELTNKKVIILELLYVHEEELRKKGIASYYLDKLIDYAISENMDYIQITANANAKNFKNDRKKNALNQKELEEFYKNKSTPKMPIKLLKHTL